MIFSKPIYAVFLDGIFIGTTDDELECWKIAEEETYGTPNVLHHDDVDRVWWHKIDVNRFFYDYHYYTNDKLSDESILCYSKDKCVDAVNTLNKLNLEHERREAKLRAMAL